MTKRRKLAPIAVIVALLLAAAWYQFGGHRTAQGQPPLAELNTASLEQLRANFNDAEDQPRMIVLLSPT
jgi:hypothetical protein